MKVCWFKAVNGHKPRKGECLDQLVSGACETCEYYRENENTENEKAVRTKKDGVEDEY